MTSGGTGRLAHGAFGLLQLKFLICPGERSNFRYLAQGTLRSAAGCNRFVLKSGDVAAVERLFAFACDV